MEPGKGGVVDNKGKNNEVVLQIPENQEASYVNRETNDSENSPITQSTSHSVQHNTQMGSSLKGHGESNTEPAEIDNVRCRVQVSSFTSSPSPKMKYLSPKPSKSPKIPVEPVTRRRTPAKSRLVEPPYPNDLKLFEEKTQLVDSNLFNRNSPNMASPNNIIIATNPRDNLNTVPVTPRTPLVRTSGEDDDDDEVHKTAELEVRQKSSKKLKLMVLIEWIAFVCIMGILIMSLTIHKLQNVVIWGLELWKWCVLVLVILSGRMVTDWFMNILVFLIESNFLLRKKVLYFVYGLKNSVQAFIWLGLVLLAWSLLFHYGVKRSKETMKILNHITRALASCLIGAAIWFATTLLIQLLASYFQFTRFFDRSQESIFHQYILWTLSGPPLMEMAEKIGKTASTGQLGLKTLNGEKEGEKEKVIDVDKWKKMKQEKVSAWTMKWLVNVMRSSGLSTISNILDSVNKEDGEQKDKETTSEWDAKTAAYRIFKNVVKPGARYIEEEDLLRFMNKDEVDNVLPLFEGAAETGKIKRRSLKNWLLKVYIERKSLIHSLNDAKTAVDELNKLASVVVVVVIVIVWLLLMGFLTTKVLLFISFQLLFVAFIFGNTAKIVFEAIIFVFVTHPFDVGDRCVIDGVQMVVEEINILTTVFLRYDNEKIFYPNSVLATRPISNSYRSPEMSDSVEFAIDVSTSI